MSIGINSEEYFLLFELLTTENKLFYNHWSYYTAVSTLFPA